MNAKELETALAGFTGTENYFKFSCGLALTDGVKFLANEAKCYWLLDAIASYQGQCRRDSKLREYQFWSLTIKGQSAELICERDAGDVAIRQKIDYTNFPLPSVRIWLVGNTVMLPSEY